MKPVDIQTRVRGLREGGMVQRFHTVPHIGDASVATHSWGVASLILELNPDPSLGLIRAALYHDAAGERWSGDVPGQVGKWIDPVLGEHQKRVEDAFARKLGVIHNLDDDETWWLKGCDMLELFLYAQEQVALGNRYMVQARDRAREWALNNGGNLPKAVFAAFQWEWHHVDDKGWWPEIREEVSKEG